MNYDLVRPWLTLDPWQTNLLKSRGNVCIVSGRQCGKSTGTSILATETALKNPNQFIIIGAYVIEQANLLLRKIKSYVDAKYPKQVKGRPTLNFIEFKNGSKIYCIPIGDTGGSMRGYTATMIIIDEAALVPDRAWEAIEPTISVTKGRVILLSTPQCKKGFFYKASENKKQYTTFTQSARNCPRHDKVFLDQKQLEMSPVAFAQEYLGEFLDDYNRKFSDEWIAKVCTIEKESVNIVKSYNVLGIDVGGGVGAGETTFEGFNIINKQVFQNLNIFSDTIQGPDIERQITSLKQKFNYGRKSIGFDSRGVGSGTFNYMLENDNLKRCVAALDNATRPVEYGIKGKRTKLLKEYMYDLVEAMGWRGDLKCFNDGAVKQSFASIQITFKPNGDRLYSGSYDHIVEGIARGVWMAKNKSLNIYCY